MAQKLYRSGDDKIIAGLCGGMGEFFDIDPTIIRIIFIILTIWGAVGIILYIIGVLVVPINPKDNSLENKGKRTEFNEKVNNIASEIKENIRLKKSRGLKGEQLLGIIVFVVGGALLMREIFPNYDFHIFWPVLLILFGIFIVVSGSRKKEK